MNTLSISEFLAWDAIQSVRSELVQGTIWPIADSSDRHNIATMNVCMALRRHLRGRSCRAYALDLKLCVPAANSVFYPDVMVTCSEADRSSRLCIRLAATRR
jgi:Uma2 family endonuclease